MPDRREQREIPAERLLAGLPPIWPRALLPVIRRRGGDRTLVILDDDPTGTQTVRGVEVLMDPSLEDLAGVLGRRPRAVFVLTNSRSLAVDRAEAIARRLGRRIRLAARRSGRRVCLISRSDSTLRGHFPAEVDALAAAAGVAAAPVLFMPYLGEAGRITVGDVHYLVRGSVAVPVAGTEFARDPAFGYRESNLIEWVRARLADGNARDVRSISIDTIRGGGPEAVAEAMRRVPDRAVVVVNAADDRDAEVIAAAAAAVEHERPIVARTAAGYVRARAGQRRQPLLAPRELRHEGGPGLVIVGSHVPTTTRQLAALLAAPPVAVEHIEVPVEPALDARARRRLLGATVARAAAALDRGTIPVIATSRHDARPGPDDPGGLRLGGAVSRLLAAAVRGLEPRPAWIIAKGGITSSDVATRGLGARHARVVGPVLSGVPVWRVARGAGRSVLLVVFPGNVGEDDGLQKAVAALVFSSGG